jgi:hypothetical protein
MIKDCKHTPREQKALFRCEIIRWRDIKGGNQEQDVGVIRGGPIAPIF